MFPRNRLTRSLITGSAVGAVIGLGIISVLATLSAYVPGSLMTCQAPCPAQESLSVDSHIVNSPTNMTLNIRSAGTMGVTLSRYGVKDAAGDSYSTTSWSGASIAYNSVGPVVILIGSSCNSCTSTGHPFTFITGGYYTITVVTGRNTQFNFLVTA